MFENYTYRIAVPDTNLCQARQSSSVQFGFCYVDQDKQEVVQIAKFMKCREYFNDWMYTAITGTPTYQYGYRTSITKDACGDHDGLEYILVASSYMRELDNILERFTTIHAIWPEATVERVDQWSATWNDYVDNGDITEGMLIIKVPTWVYRDTVAMGLFTAIVRMAGYDDAEYVPEFGIWYKKYSSEAGVIYRAVHHSAGKWWYNGAMFRALVAQVPDEASFSAFAADLESPDCDDDYCDINEVIHEHTGPSCVTSCGMTGSLIAYPQYTAEFDAMTEYVRARCEFIVDKYNEYKNESEAA